MWNKIDYMYLTTLITLLSMVDQNFLKECQVTGKMLYSALQITWQLYVHVHSNVVSNQWEMSNYIHVSALISYHTLLSLVDQKFKCYYIGLSRDLKTVYVYVF